MLVTGAALYQYSVANSLVHSSSNDLFTLMTFVLLLYVKGMQYWSPKKKHIEQATKEEYKSTTWIFNDADGKAKAQLGLRVTSDVS
ncbi:unnamed protein product, partial [Bubo scandiacus]